MFGRFLSRAIEAQAGWSMRLAVVYERVVARLLADGGWLKDVLHGRWLGHPLHAAITDIPIGSLIVVVIQDVANQGAAADIALFVTLVAMIVAIASGAADFKETDDTARTRGALHGTLMLVGFLAVALSVVLRAAGPDLRVFGVWSSILGLLIVATGAYVGGDLVFVLGSMVKRHAFDATRSRWSRLEPDTVDLSSLEEGVPYGARTASNNLVLVRLGENIHVLDDRCAHSGAPLSRGMVADDCIICPLHGTRFRLRDGRVVVGPSVYDQPTYEVRPAIGGGYEVRRS